MLEADPRLAELVRQRLASAYETALNLVERRAADVEAIAERLLARRALGPQEISEIIGLPRCRS